LKNTGRHINWQPAHLENDVVRLQPLNENHFNALYEIASDPLIWLQHNEKDRYKKEVFQQFFSKAIESRSAFLIIERKTGMVIGSTRFYDYNIKDNSIVIGFTFLGRQFWSRGYNPSVKKLMLGYAFQYVDKVIFHVAATNIRSQIAVGRLGAIKTAEFMSEHSVEPKLSYQYELTKKMWVTAQ